MKINDKRSYDINDFDISRFRGLTVEDGAATIVEYTIEIIANKITSKNIIVCGGGRKNKYLLERLENKIKNKIVNIDDFKIDGDFVESQAFAYLAIRSFLKLPITFPNTTGCELPSTGGILTKNF
jgi:anhydro-N-acetylmuramic acid kinase